MLRNRIEYFGNGLHAIEGSSPVLQDQTSGGYNVIRNNHFAIKCEDQSDAILGYTEGGDEGGMNSIDSSETYDVVLVKSTVNAQNNWWGSPDSADFRFSIDEDSKLFFVPWLDYDPNQGNRPFAGIGTPIVEHASLSLSDSEYGEADPRLTPTPPIMRQVLAQRTRGRYNEAMVLLRSIISDALLPGFVREWAVGQLLPVGLHLTNPNLSGYLRTVGQTHPELRRKVRAVLPRSYLLERSGQNAIAAYDSNIQRYPNSSLHREGLYGKFVLALYIDTDTSQARAFFTALRSTFPTSTERYIAEIQLANYQAGTVGAMNIIQPPGKATPSANARQLPERFGLSQNYPNPFNPTTVIRYQLPEDAFVTLKVYDVLGREMRALINEHLKAGYYEVKLDASRFASGTYFYRFAAGGYHEVKKFVVLK